MRLLLELLLGLGDYLEIVLLFVGVTLASLAVALFSR
jgi:hypothetical protein